MSKSVCSYCFGSGEAQPEERFDGALVENERSVVITAFNSLYEMDEIRLIPKAMDIVQEAHAVIRHDQGKQLTYQGTSYRLCSEAQHRVDTGTNPPFCHTCAGQQIDQLTKANDQVQEMQEMVKNLRLGLLYASQRLEFYGKNAQAENACKIGGIAYTKDVINKCEHVFSHHCETCGLSSEIDGLIVTERQTAEKALREIAKMTEHDSPVNVIAAEALSHLLAYQDEQ